MSLDEIKDRLFDTLNDSNDLPIADIMVNDAENKINLYLEDGTIATITCAITGSWMLFR